MPLSEKERAVTHIQGLTEKAWAEIKPLLPRLMVIEAVGPQGPADMVIVQKVLAFTIGKICAEKCETELLEEQHGS
jgi:hypothetical protein